MVLIFRRVGDRIQLVRRNIHYKAPAGSSLDKAVKQNYTDSVLMALPIIALNPMTRRRGPDRLFRHLHDRLRPARPGHARPQPEQLDQGQGLPQQHGAGGRGHLQRRRPPLGYMGGGDGVADHRGITVVIHYSLMKTPDFGYHPRVADDRVGHFLSATKDFGVTDADSNFVRLINRWRLEKANPAAKLSPPRKQIVWYVEDTVPIEYRPYVEEGIREWNKAFEKIGFKDAIAVRWEESGRDDFDPEDTNYCTFRWITSDNSYAMSCLRANPLTGEMIDGDVVFDASFIRYWKQQYALLVGSTTAANGKQQTAPLAIGEVISPILASKMGYGQPQCRSAARHRCARQEPQPDGPRGRPRRPELPVLATGQEPGAGQPRLLPVPDRASSATSAWPRSPWPTRRRRAASRQATKDKDKDKAEKKKPQPKDELPEEFIGQAIKEIVMHEVGHSLGLRHNFKASTMLTADQLNDTAITHAKGLVGSVMDYSPINIAPKGKKQGDYYTTTIGPYDYWAIEYAYKPVDGDEAAELKKIAARAPEHDLVYATDEDSFLNDDPYVNRWDLGSDPCQFGKERIALATELLKDLDARVVKDGESWARTRRAFSILLEQWGDGATLASQYVGGQSVSRDHKADKDARDPIVPVPGPSSASA